MKEINIPGFNAERSLGRSGAAYRAAISTASKGRVTPAMNYECWNYKFTETYVRCTLIGFDPYDCLDTAIDLANSICEGWVYR
jgi:hypothetical protein